MTTTADYYPLCDAIRRAPDEDTPRLMFADFLDERDAEYVKCPKCKGKGFYSFRSAEFGYEVENCRDCGGTDEHKGTGSIRDDTPRALAELVRVGVELKRLQPPDDTDIEFKRYACEGCWVVSDSDTFPGVPGRCPHCGYDRMRKVRTSGQFTEYVSLKRRECDLLAANPALRPTCPVCGGDGAGSPGILGLLARDCYYCSGTGRIGAYPRGGLTLAVPSLGTLWERERLDPRLGLGPRLDQYTTPLGEWQLTDYGRMLRDRYPWITAVEVGDRVPFKFSSEGITKWVWLDDHYGREQTPSRVPRMLFTRLPGTQIPSDRVQGAHKEFDTLDLASQALARAVAMALFAPEDR